jgi:hypothetical protein
MTINALSNQGATFTVTATCTSGKAISGGGTIVNTGAQIVALTDSKPVGTPNPSTWTVTGTVVLTGTGNSSIRAHVVCG